MSAAFTHPRQCARGPLTGAGFSAGMVDFDRAVFSGGVSFDGAAFPKCLVAFRGAMFSGGTVSLRYDRA